MFMAQTKPVPGMPKLAESRGSFVVEKRRETRYPTNDPAQVQILPSNGTWLPCTVVDISRCGLRLALETKLTKNTRIEIMITPRQVVIFGEVRYCRMSGDRYHAGVLIEGVVFPKPDTGEHLNDEQLLLYMRGKGLTAPQLLRMKNHLLNCDECVARLVETTREWDPAGGKAADVLLG
jgi:PilZ domain-containing protein